MILIILFSIGGIVLLVCYGFIKHYYLKDKYENLISKNLNSIGYKIKSIKTVDKPGFIIEREISGIEFFNPFPIITTYRFVELEYIEDKKQSAFVSIERILYTKLTLKYYLDIEGNGDYKLLES